MRKLTGYVTDREGNAVAGAEVYIRKQSDNSLLQLYSDDGSTTTANPLSTDNDGEWSAFFADNTVKIQIFTEGVQQQEINNYQHFDLDNISAFIWTLLDDADAETARATLGVAIGSDVQAYDAKLAAIAALADPNADRIYFWDDSAGAPAFLAASTGLSISGTDLLIDKATAANYRADASNKVVTTDIVWDAAEPVALSESGGNVAVDLNTGINFTLAMAGNYTLSNPTNEKPGQNGFIQITQDATGSRTLAYGSEWKFAGGSDPVLSTAADSVDVLFYQVLSSGNILGNLVKAVA